jgi:2-polyprenyl-3-methyl-5-hydroxy-6-metoxy-1,4-benzoquinol methylase
MLHWLSNEREIKGIDYDEDKIITAQHCYLRNEQVSFEYADVTSYEFEKYDAYVISDVLHYLQADEQEKVLSACIRQLGPDGVIIVRDGDSDLVKRHEGTRLTEFFSTKLIGFNKTKDKPLSFFSSSRIREIVTAHGAVMEQIDNTRFTSNVIFIIKKLSPQHAAI